VTTTPVDDLADPVWTLIDNVTNVDAFDAEDPAPTFDGDGRVHAYAVYYPSPGWAHALLGCGGTDSLDWTFQVTCVGGDRTRALWCVSKIRAALTGQRVSIGGQLLTIQEIGNPGPIRRDDNETPPRFYAPLTFAVYA
jgi:hypothetical protein